MKSANKKKNLMQAVTLLGALSHPVRLSILCNLHHRGEMNVGEIIEAEGGAASQSQISQFLAAMKSDGLVKSRKQGQFVYYTIASRHVRHVISALYESYCGQA